MSEPAHVLIVDDEPLNVDYIQQELEDLGYETSIAVNGREALERVVSDPPDLILLDVMMPDIDGITVCRLLKDDPVTALIPIVIMTALDAREDRIRGIEAGADDFLTKPVDDRELVARIATALRTKRAIDRAFEELDSASRQLARHGPWTLDATVLLVELRFAAGTDELPQEALGFLAREHVVAMEERIREAGGEVIGSSDTTMTALFQHESPARHLDATLAAADAVEACNADLNARRELPPLVPRLAIASGLVRVASVRVEGNGGARWSLAVDGDAADEARRVLAADEPGTVLAPSAAARVGDGPATEPVVAVPGARRVLRRADSGTLDGGPARPTRPDRSGAGWWPDAYAGLEPVVRRAWGIDGDVYLTRELGGKSGALVYAVDLTCRDFAGQAILKLAAMPDASWDEPEEAERHEAAARANPAYAEARLPRIVHAHQHEQQLAILSTIAGRGLEYALPWAECPYGQQVDAVRMLASELLESWNRDYLVAPGLLQPSELLRAWLDYRLGPELGRIQSFVADEIGLDPRETTFMLEGHWYPNPVAFAADAVALPERARLRALTGRLHGDLHGHNVLVRSPGQTELSYYLIDLAMFEDSAYLLYDHAYLELAHLLAVRGAHPVHRWLALLDALARGTVPDADDLGLVQLVAALRGEVRDWTDRHEPNRPAYVESQYALARVAAGLAFVHKTLTDLERRRAFLYGAVALKGYLKFLSVDWPKQGDAIAL